MSKYDKIYLGNKAKDLGFNRDTLEKVTRLYDVLRYINTMPVLKTELALKGGTAINFTMLELPRLSVDIDLDFLIPCDKEKLVLHRQTINEIFYKYMTNEGYELISKSKFTYSLDSFVYRYIGVSGNYDNIKIEINYSLRSHIDPTESVDAIHPYFSNDFQIHRLSMIEIVASKINALLTRAASRDLYDIFNVIEDHLIKDEHKVHLRKSIIFYFLISSNRVDTGIGFKKIDGINEQMIRRDLRPVLSRNDGFQLEKAKEVVKHYLQSLLKLTDDEKRFIQSFTQKNYHPELLFSDDSQLERIQNHPMALWRTK
jgi:predicted nucleotidyltransferase component of viral defense system